MEKRITAVEVTKIINNRIDDYDWPEEDVNKVMSFLRDKEEELKSITGDSELERLRRYKVTAQINFIRYVMMEEECMLLELTDVGE